MIQLKMKKDTKNYFQRILNKVNNNFMVWHGNCYSSRPVIEITGFESFLDEKALIKRKI